jgi:protein AFG1
VSLKQLLGGDRVLIATLVNPDNRGPLDEYNARVDAGTLRDDQHQRGTIHFRSFSIAAVDRVNSGIIQSLQHLHDELKEYRPRPIVHSHLEEMTKPKRTLFGSLFKRKSANTEDEGIPENLPKGLYLYGDVGSGKTMLMDMFYDTLPKNVTSKTRIHFLNFMQDVHQRVHKLRMEKGQDFDAMPYVGADIAEKGRILCFDEFQCTDVADAMILRR